MVVSPSKNGFYAKSSKIGATLFWTVCMYNNNNGLITKKHLWGSLSLHVTVCCYAFINNDQ